MAGFPQGSLSAGFRKSLFKDRMTLRVNVNDIFHTDVITSEIKYMNVDAAFTEFTTVNLFDSIFIQFWKTNCSQIKRQRSMGHRTELNRRCVPDINGE